MQCRSNTDTGFDVGGAGGVVIHPDTREIETFVVDLDFDATDATVPRPFEPSLNLSLASVTRDFGHFQPRSFRFLQPNFNVAWAGTIMLSVPSRELNPHLTLQKGRAGDGSARVSIKSHQGTGDAESAARKWRGTHFPAFCAEEASEACALSPRLTKAKFAIRALSIFQLPAGAASLTLAVAAEDDALAVVDWPACGALAGAGGGLILRAPTHIVALDGALSIKPRGHNTGVESGLFVCGCLRLLRKWSFWNELGSTAKMRTRRS
jgi:hypothetical protein